MEGADASEECSSLPNAPRQRVCPPPVRMPTHVQPGSRVQTQVHRGSCHRWSFRSPEPRLPPAEGFRRTPWSLLWSQMALAFFV